MRKLLFLLMSLPIIYTGSHAPDVLREGVRMQPALAVFSSRRLFALAPSMNVEHALITK